MCWDIGAGIQSYGHQLQPPEQLRKASRWACQLSWDTVLRAEEGDAHGLYCCATQVTVPDGLTPGSDLNSILLMNIIRKMLAGRGRCRETWLNDTSHVVDVDASSSRRVVQSRSNI